MIRDFKIFNGTDGSISLRIDRDRVAECLQYARKNRITRITITDPLTDMSLLSESADFVKGLTILPDRIGLGAVNQLHGLIDLGVGDNGRDTVDLSNFPNLESASIRYGRRLAGLENCRNLKHLTINGYNPKSADMTELPDLPTLSELWIFKGNLTSLQGIDRLALDFLWLYSLPKLVSISAVTSLSESLRKLQIESCRWVTDFDSLRSMRALEKLMISDSGSIPSIEFVREIPRLVFFSFSGTSIENGDLSPLEGLKYAGFDDKRHYSKKRKDFQWEQITWDD